MRRAMILILWLCCLLSAFEARGQEAILVQPYQVLHGRRLPMGPALSSKAVELPPAVVALLRARTDNLLARMTADLAPFTSGGVASAPDKITKVADELNDGLREARALRDRGQIFAALQKASLYYVGSEIVKGVLQGFVRLAIQQKTGGQASLSRLPEMRSRLDSMQAKLDAIRPTSASVVVALCDGYGQWIDAQSLLRLVSEQQTELWTLLDSVGAPAPPDKRDEILHVVIEPIVGAIIQFADEQVDLELQASQADRTAPAALRLDEQTARRLASAYDRAARANFAFADSRAETRPLPPDKFRTTLLRLGGLLIESRFAYLRAHRDDTGPEAAFLRLAVSFAAYRDSLATLSWVDVLGADSTATDVEKSTQISAALSLHAERQQRLAQASLAQTQTALGHVPIPVLLALRGGQQLRGGSFDERELALDSLVEASVLAQLAAGLAAPPPQDETLPALPPPSGEPGDDVQSCFERLAHPDAKLEDRATGYAQKRRWSIPPADLRDIIREAILRTCSHAKDLTGNLGPLFWDIFRDQAADWFRDVSVYERARPKLTATCEEIAGPDDVLLRGQRCDRLHQAMSQLDSVDRQVLKLQYEEELSYAQIGQRIGCSEDAASKRASRARAQLRKQLKDLDPQALRGPGQAPWVGKMLIDLQHLQLS